MLADPHTDRLSELILRFFLRTWALYARFGAAGEFELERNILRLPRSLYQFVAYIYNRSKPQGVQRGYKSNRMITMDASIAGEAVSSEC